MSGGLSRDAIGRTARSLTFAAASAGSGVLLLGLLILAGRLLGDRDYGRFTFALALATIIETLIDFGLKELVAREVARDASRARALIAHMFGLKVVSGLAGLGVLTAAAWVMRSEPEVRLACLLLGVSSLLRSFWMTLRHTLNGLQRFDLESAVVVVDRVLLLAFGAAALLGGRGLTGLCLAFVAARAGALVFAAVVTRPLVGRIALVWEPRAWGALQQQALPFGVFVAVLNIYSYVDALMIGVLRTDVEVGHYGAAYRIYEGFINGAVIIATVAGPKLSRAFVSADAHHARLVRFAIAGSLLASVPFVLVGTLFAAPLLGGLFDASYVPGAGALQLLSCGLFFVFPLQIAHAIAISVNRERVLVAAAFVGCVLNVGLNSVLIPRSGIDGAALATLVSEAASLTYLVWRLRGAAAARVSAVP